MADELNTNLKPATAHEPQGAAALEPATLEPGDTITLGPTITGADWRARGISDLGPFRMLNPA